MAVIKQYKTKDGEKRYFFRIYLGVDEQTGKKRQTTRRGFKTKREAKLEISKLELEIEKGGIKKPQQVSFKQVYDEYVEAKRLTVRESTIYSFNLLIKKHVLPKIGDKRIGTIGSAELQRLVNSIFKKTANYKNIYSRLRSIFKLARQKGYVDKDPFEFVTLPTKHVIKDKENFYSRDELQAFLSLPYFASHFRELTFFRLLAFSGMRKGEALALRWSDFSFDERTVSISKTISIDDHGRGTVNVPKTKNSHRTVILDTRTLSMLRQLKLDQVRQLMREGIGKLKDAIVFSPDGTHHYSANVPNNWLRLAYKGQHIDHITVHGFRHTHASMLFEAGVSIKEAQLRLGHSNATTTLQVYTHVTDKQSEKAADKFAKFADF